MKRFKAVGGGYLQRGGRASASGNPDEDPDDGDHHDEAIAPPEDDAGSHLAVLFKREMLWGHLPASKIARFARAAVRDGLAHPEMVKLSKLASSGTVVSHAWRNYKSKHKAPELMRAVGNVRIPLKHGVDAVKWDQVSLLYPHKIFATLHDSYPNSFREHFLGGDDRKIPQFWAEMVDHPGYASHPMHNHKRYEFRTQAVPLKVYGDGTPGTGIGKAWSKMIDAIIISSCVAHTGKSWLGNFIVTLVHELLMSVDENKRDVTMDALWKEIVWSMYWLYQGVHPDRGPDNILYVPADGEKFRIRLTPLAGGYFGVVWVIAGDLDYCHKRLYFADFNKPSEPCTCCGANNTDAPWTQCIDGNCAWQLRIYTNATYAAAKPGRHMLLKHVPGVGVVMYIPDEMHSKHLGIDKSFAGSVLRNLTHHVLVGSDKENLVSILVEIRRDYTVHKTTTRFQTITANMIQGRAKLPQLRGKAAQIRSLLPTLARVWERHMDREEPEHRDMLAGLESSVEIDRILRMHRGAPRLPLAARTNFRAACFRYVQAQAALVAHYHPHTALFNVTTKSHLLLHLGMIAAYINPSLGAVWQGEDMMQVVRRLIAASSVGNNMVHAQRSSMDRYCRALGFELELSS